MSAMTATALTEQECALIAEFNRTKPKTSFTEQTGHMIHTVENCRSGSDCSIPLRKRSKPVMLLIEGHESVLHLEDLVIQNMQYAKDLISEASGIDWFWLQESVEKAAILVVFVAAGPIDDLNVQDRKLLEWFSEDPQQICVAVSYDQ